MTIDSVAGAYVEGFGLGLDWLDTPAGRGYLAGSDVEVPEPAEQGRREGFADAVKDTGWHLRNPGKQCRQGENCPAVVRLVTRTRYRLDTDDPEMVDWLVNELPFGLGGQQIAEQVEGGVVIDIEPLRGLTADEDGSITDEDGLVLWAGGDPYPLYPVSAT